MSVVHLALVHLARIPGTGSFRRVTQPDELPGGEVRAVLAASTGDVWFAVRGRGVAMLRGDA